MILRILSGIFLILHGLVHLLYLGHARGLFELSPGLAWPDGSWAFSRLLGGGGTRLAASAACALAALGFAAGGAGFLAQQAWWRPVVIASALLSIAMYLLFWDGNLKRLPDKGAVGILISAAALATVMIFT